MTTILLNAQEQQSNTTCLNGYNGWPCNPSTGWMEPFKPDVVPFPVEYKPFNG